MLYARLPYLNNYGSMLSFIKINQNRDKIAMYRSYNKNNMYHKDLLFRDLALYIPIVTD